MKLSALTLWLAMFLQIPCAPPKEVMWISQVEFQLILRRMERTEDWAAAACVLRNQGAEWRYSAWVPYDMFAYSYWQDAYAKAKH